MYPSQLKINCTTNILLLLQNILIKTFTIHGYASQINVEHYWL